MEFIVDWNSVCLVCLQEGDMKSIYDKDAKNMTLSEKIMTCSSIEIQRGMSLPEQICHLCCNDLEAAYRFRTNCESTNIILKSFVTSNITSLEIPATNGVPFKYKLPTGLEMKRVKTKRSSTPEIKVKTEVLPEINEITVMDEQDVFREYTICDDVYDDEDDEPLSNIKKLQVDHLDQNLADILEEADQEQDRIENMKVEDAQYVETKPVTYKTKKGRPRKGKSTKSSSELKGGNVRKLVDELTTVTYVRKNRDDLKPPKICEICGNSYKFQHALESHMRRHRNEKPFSCEFCERAFVANVELRRHMRVHTGQKPYACRHCNRRFSDFGSRIKHERTHTGERPYPCQTCGKAFAYAHVLQVHTLTHTGEKKYKCHVCTKGFTKKSYLNGHMKLHADDHSNILTVRADSPDEPIQAEVVYVKDEDY